MFKKLEMAHLNLFKGVPKNVFSILKYAPKLLISPERKNYTWMIFGRESCELYFYQTKAVSQARPTPSISMGLIQLMTTFLP